jgi:hypothetical protein
MIYQKQFFEGIDKEIENAIDFIHYGLGMKYDIQLIFGKLSEDRLSALEKQGSNINDVNKLREKNGMIPLNPSMNFKILKKGWGKNLLDGSGLVFAVQSKQYRFKTNRDIEGVFEWFIQEKPLFKIETINCPKYDLFFITFKKSKEEKPIDETPVQILDPTL